MADRYSSETCSRLSREFAQLRLRRPMRKRRYDAGEERELILHPLGVQEDMRARVRIEAFAGAGFAGQVYRVQLMDLAGTGSRAQGMRAGQRYAMKIMVPVSRFSRWFRGFLFWLGFQGAFQLQTNITALRAAALWQKVLRRAAGVEMGDEGVVNDVHAVFTDPVIGSCGELSDWVDGRTWRLEVDDHLDVLKRHLRGKPVEPAQLGSPEYRAKKQFMAGMTAMMRRVGAVESARQYEWWTAKSQPNCLQRTGDHQKASSGLVAVDFRPGLVLLPLLPMSPADVVLILRGLRRGALVQFDRGDLKRLRAYVNNHEDAFVDMRPMLQDLERCERVYRRSLPDLFWRLSHPSIDRGRWRAVLNAAVEGWRVKNIIDTGTEKRLKCSSGRAAVWTLLGAIPLIGKSILRLLGNGPWRDHLVKMLTSPGYLRRSYKGRRIEVVTHWYRDGRLSVKRTEELSRSGWRFLLHLPLSLFPVGLHRFLTDWAYCKQRLAYLFIRPLKLYFDENVRREWLLGMIGEGEKKQILSADDASQIRDQLDEPFIQKYLKSLAVHVCTLPVTQVVSILVSWLYVRLHPELSPGEAVAAVAAILVLFQITPISPGSLVRGFYVVYLGLRERNFRDYNIAVGLSFFKYIGYLAFPIQMAYRYPALARFMAGHWATEAVHIVPVFGERGALLEHWVFNLFYNWPLTVRRRIKNRLQRRKTEHPRRWHYPVLAVAAGGILCAGALLFQHWTGFAPLLKDIWPLAILLAFGTGALGTALAAGEELGRRFFLALLSGIAVALISGAAQHILFSGSSSGNWVNDLFWRVFILGLTSLLGAVITEIRMPDPGIAQRSSTT